MHLVVSALQGTGQRRSEDPCTGRAKGQLSTGSRVLSLPPPSYARELPISQLSLLTVL